MWRSNPDVLVTDLKNELVLLHPASSEMFSLNPAARLLWHSLPATLDSLAARLSGQYGLEALEARRDAERVMRDLQGRDLVREG